MSAAPESLPPPDAAALRRKRRRRRRIEAVLAFLAMAMVLAWFFEQQSTTTVIFVRFAEAETGPAGDARLSAAGRARAEELRRVLMDVDVDRGLNAVYVSSYRPTRETAEPVARQFGIKIEEFDPNNIPRLERRVLKIYKGRIVLVVGDGPSIRAAIPEFHGSKKVPPEVDVEADQMYIVTIPWYGKVKTLRLRYGVPTASPAPPEPATPGEGADPSTAPPAP
ncbi:MAG: histidine phosphatase family protein [Chromatiales bacterium]|jgi:broad specificity phosphatase PhoE|nr:histidine phosphatase family protein [Chromatiales bacterium]